jgi:uncharacterized membrane protein
MNNEYDSKWLIGMAKFLVPFIIGIATVGLTGIFIVGEGAGKYWALVSAYFFPPLGKESVIPIGIFGGEIQVPIINKAVTISPIDPLVMALSIAFVDIIVALFLLWNFDLAKKIPLVGKFITKIEELGQVSSDKYGWLKPLRFIGIVLFVMVPLQGSGGLVGSIVGRLIGMKPINTFFAICVGAIVGCTLIAYFADLIIDIFQNNFVLGLIIVIILVAIGFMIFVYRRNSNKK